MSDNTPLLIGEIRKKADGQFVWIQPGGIGLRTSLMRKIADAIDNLNADAEEQGPDTKQSDTSHE